MINFIDPDTTIGHMMSSLLQSKPFKASQKITLEQYTEWKDRYSFDGLRGLRYGQSFCNHFDISDNILYYTIFDVGQCDDYIMKRYVESTHLET
jgi:hypothetical protein